jgi:flagellar biosynthesis/type III secretory pathway chaperone
MSEQLLTHIEQTCQTLLACLEEEFRALGARKFETVMSLAQDKQTLLQQLDELDQQVHTLTNVRQHKRWPALRDLLQKCREQNEANGLLLNRSFQLTRETLGILTGRPQQNTVYSPSGLQQSAGSLLENVRA